MRTSKVAYVVVRLAIGGDEYFLMRVHEKWGDWSLVGGHLEPREAEADDWLGAARRESEEELVPLRNGSDFTLEQLSVGLTSWGPQESRSAGGALTNYEAAWFVLRFVHDPVRSLERLRKNEFMLVDRRLVLAPRNDTEVTSLLKRLDGLLDGGIGAVPLSWRDSIAENAVPLGLRRSSAS